MSGANNIKLNLSDDVKKAIVNSFVNFVNTGNANSSTSNTSNSTSNTSNSTSNTSNSTSNTGDLQKYLANNEIYNNKKKLLKSNYDQNNASLLQNYNAQSQGLEQNKKDSQQAAAIAHQKLLKYLPEYNASMGLYGNGASESALLEANARYRSTQGQIAANYNSQKAQLDADHSARQASLLQNYNQDQMDLYSEAAAKYEADQAKAEAKAEAEEAKAEAKAEAEEAKKKADQENLYNMALNTINGWTGSAKDLEDYKNGLKDELTEDQFKSLEQAYNTAFEVAVEDEKYTPQDISAEGNIKVTPPDNYSKGKNFTVKVGNSEYAVQIGDEISSGAAKTTAINGNVGDGEVFAYGGELYIKNGESVYRVEKRFWGSDKYADLKTAVGLSA